jgi:2'-5' RNA ligase
VTADPGSTDGTATQRLFIAVDVSAATGEAIGRALAPLRASERAVAWVADEKLHLTLRFLGEQPVAGLPALRAALSAAAGQVPALRLGLGGFGAFPSIRRPRVLWIGVEANVALALLYQKVDDACASLGLGREARPFHPHLTIGRVRPRAAPDPGTLADAARLLDTRWTTDVSTLDLMSSRLGPGGARYERLLAAPLAAESR